VLLGNDLLAWIVLALGAAMAVGNVLALVRPPPQAGQRDLPKAPLGRTALMIVVGAIAAIWALASLLGG
jgi:hypothetical protein